MPKPTDMPTMIRRFIYAFVSNAEKNHKVENVQARKRLNFWWENSLFEWANNNKLLNFFSN